MKSISPWPLEGPCPEPEFVDFRYHLLEASFHNAGSQLEWLSANTEIAKAARVAIDADWPFWAIERMFKEVAPLVEWSQFMQTYINILKAPKT